MLELSRQRLKVTEDQKISIKCTHCNGYGSVLSNEFLINQILRTLSEIKFDRPKDEIFLLCNSALNEKLNEVKNKQKVNEKLLKIRVFDELNNEEFIICKANEIIIKNSHLNIEIEVINQILKRKKAKQKSKKSVDKKTPIS